jgi:hypothetical protein
VSYLPPAASAFLTAGFTLFAVVVALLFISSVALAGARLQESVNANWSRVLGVATVTAAWMAMTWRLAETGALLAFDRRPPPLFVLMVAVLAVSVAIAFSPVGTRLVKGLPLAVLIGFQSFRFPLELLMHRAATEGVMPAQMSYSGRNFDIVSGISAAIVALLIWRRAAGRSLAVFWNIAGALLLANILVVAMVSTPALAAFGPDRLNTWVCYPPFVWLPTVFVVLAIAGHLLVARKLRAGG